MVAKETLEDPYAWHVETDTLENGFSYTLHPMPWAYAIASEFSILAGPRFVKAAHSAVPHWYEHHGADNAFGDGSYDHVEDAFEIRSGHHEEHTTQEIVGGETKLFPEHDLFGLEFFRSLYYETPLTPENHIREKRIVHNEKLRGMDTPSTRLEDRISYFMWRGHGLEYGVDGSLQSIQEELTEQNFIDFRSNLIWADRSKLFLAGKLDVQKVRQDIQRVFGDLPKRDAAHPNLPAPVYTRGERGVFIEPFDSELAYIGLKFQIQPQYLQQDHDVNILLTRLAERQTYGRLVNQLGLAYTVEVTLETFQDFGTLYFETAVLPKDIETAAHELIGSLNNLQTDAGTVEKRIGGIIREHLLDLDAPDKRIEFLEEFPGRSPEKVKADFQALRESDLPAAKARLFRTDSVALGAITPDPVSPSLVPVLDEMLQFDEQPQRIPVSQPTIFVPSFATLKLRKRKP